MAKEVKEADKKETPVAEESPSMEDILQSIRGVISGEDEEDDDDILELTEMVDETEESTAEAVVEENADSAPAEGEAAPDEAAADAPVEEAVSEEPAAEPEQEAAAEEGQEDSASLLDTIDDALGEDGSGDAEEQAPAEEAVAEEAAPEEAVAAEDDDTLEGSAADSAPETEGEKKARMDRLLTEKTETESSSSLKDFMNKIPKVHLDSPGLRSGNSLEDLVIEALRPMLAEWLNENLATIVKQLVEREIRHLVPQDDD
ncbi:DUF2497 domain-containing protein [Rickettsiales bacterium]|nr:DUF2497 domain-containing protein [Rickettsiales bacterium]